MWKPRLWATICIVAQLAVVGSTAGAQSADGSVDAPIHAEVDGSHEIAATGHGTANVRVRIVDAAGRSLSEGTAVRATVTRGAIFSLNR